MVVRIKKNVHKEGDMGPVLWSVVKMDKLVNAYDSYARISKI